MVAPQKMTRWSAAAILAALTVGAVALTPAVRAPHGIDDRLHAAMLDGVYPGAPAPWNLYDFVSDESREAMHELGALPWWASPEIELRFLRPLASLTIALDDALFDRAALPAHLHSLLWWAVAVLGASALYRRTLPRAVAAVATIVFALAPCHAMPVAWIAARASLISLAFGTLGLAKYLDWRREGRGRDAALATLAFSLCVAAGEQSVGIFAYVLVIEWQRRDDTKGERIRGLVPAMLPPIAYAIAWFSLDYGTRGFGLYGAPSDDLGALLVRAPARYLAGLLHAWLALGDRMLPRGVPLANVAAAALALLLVVAPCLAWARRRFAAADRSCFDLYLCASLLALLPLLGVESSPRRVGFGVLGVAPLVAFLLLAAWRAGREGESEGSRLQAKAILALAALLAAVHLLLAPMNSFEIGSTYRTRFTSSASRASELGDEVAQWRDDPLLVLGGRSWWSLPFELRGEGGPPLPVLVLTEGDHVLFTRTGPSTLEAVGPPGEGVVPRAPSSFILARPLSRGDTFERRGAKVTVLDASGGVAERIRVDFEIPLDGLVWVVERHGLFHPVPQLPPGHGMPLDQ